MAAAVSTAAGVTVSAAGVAAVSAFASEAAGADADAEPASSMEQTTVLIWTVAPSATLISFKVPAAGEGISASTLSVEISKSGSSRWTVSPGFLSHLVMVPSVMDSPIWGMTTSVGIDFSSPSNTVATAKTRPAPVGSAVEHTLCDYTAVVRLPAQAVR